MDANEGPGLCDSDARERSRAAGYSTASTEPRAGGASVFTSPGILGVHRARDQGSRTPALSAYLLFFISGAAGLGYQAVWTRMFAPGLGHEMPALLAVISAFFCGMALGAWALDRRVSLTAHPARWYGCLELSIGIWGAASVLLIPWADRLARPLIGLDPSAVRHWVAAFGLPWLTLLPATAAMGATLPALERFVSDRAGQGACVGALYAANTLGAMAGTLGVTGWLMPALGFRETAMALAVLNLISGVGAFWLGAHAGVNQAARASRRVPPGGSGPLDGPNVQRSTLNSQRSTPGGPGRRLYLAAGLTGLLGIAYETIGVRVLAQVLQGTVYTYAAVLAVYLVGTAIGAALYQGFRRAHDGFLAAQRDLARRSDMNSGRKENREKGLGFMFRPEFMRKLMNQVPLDAWPGTLLCAVSVACGLGVYVLSHAAAISEATQPLVHGGLPVVFRSELITAGAFLLLPALAMGATFSHLVQAARHASGGVGTAAALNMLGGAAAPVLAASVLPIVGSKWLLGLISLSYLGVARLFHPPPAGGAAARATRSGWAWTGGLAAGIIGLVMVTDLRKVDLPPGGMIVDYREGVLGTVAVLKEASGHRVLRVDNRFQMGGTASADAESLHAHLPLLLHPRPTRALFLGLGTGITFGTAALYSPMEADGVELVPEVVEVMRDFEPENRAPASQPGLRVHVADARRFVQVAKESYDVIVADLFHPARDGAGLLYTREHFEAIRHRLAPGGLFCQWLPLHQLDEPTLRTIVRTFLEVFPETQAWLLRLNVDAPVAGLIGFPTRPEFSLPSLDHRFSQPRLAAELKRLALTDPLRFFGCFLTGPDELREFGRSAGLNTDDRPLVLFEAPRFEGRKRRTDHGRLFTLLGLKPDHLGQALGLVAGLETEAFERRLADYHAARDLYLTGLVAEADGLSGAAIDAYVASARRSSEFTSGYAQCLTIAALEAKAKPAEARRLLERLAEAQPARRVAQEMLERLFGTPAGREPGVP